MRRGALFCRLQADTCLAEGRRQPLAPRVPYLGRKICEQSQVYGTSSLTPISPLFSFAHSILMNLRQWKINFQPRIKLNDNIDIHTRRCDFRKSWPTHIVSTVIHRSRFLVQGSITHLGSKQHNIGLLHITQQNCSRIIKWYIHRNSSKKFKISFFFVQQAEPSPSFPKTEEYCRRLLFPFQDNQDSIHGPCL